MAKKVNPKQVEETLAGVTDETSFIQKLLIDDAILAVERDNPNLKSKLPRDYARRGIDPVKMTVMVRSSLGRAVDG